MKHINGPWDYRIKNAGNGYMVSDSEGYNLCDVFMTNEPLVALHRARLIAAAPDLLEACKAVVEDLAIGTEGYTLVKAAIKKAEGR